MADLKKTVEIIFEGNDKASQAARQIEASFTELGNQSTVAASKVDQVERSLMGIGGAKTAISAATTALAALATSAAFGAFIDANVNVERFESGLRALNGASVNTTAELEFVRQVANRLGLDIRTTADAYLQLTAATKGTSLEGQQTRDIFEAVSKAMGALGKSSSDTQGALLAISQIVSKGTVSMEELRGQLGERLPGAFQLAAKSMGVTTEELDKLVSSGKLAADDFLPKFAAEIDKAFAGASFDTYTANMNRLRNAIDDLLVQAGKAGLFDAVTGLVEESAEFLQNASTGADYYSAGMKAFFDLLKTGDVDAFSERLKDIELRARMANAEMDAGLNQTLAETNRLMRQAADATKNTGDEFEAETARLQRQTKAAGESIAEIDAALKRLGVDPKKVAYGIEEIAKDLEALAKNPRVNGEVFAAAFEASLKKIKDSKDLKALQEQLFKAFEGGKISADELEKGLKNLDSAYSKLEGSGGKAGKGVDEAAKAMEKAAKDAERAEERAQQFRLEMEKLASNERIKLIEATVTLNVAQVEADTKRIEASFESINNTVTSTGDLLSDLFGLLKDYDSLSFAAIRLIEKQIEQENAARQGALTDQRKLIDAQIKEIQARTRAIEKGDSVIKVDGAGLQPHLEAFMWEILRTIQVRANRDGLAMLLGT